MDELHFTLTEILQIYGRQSLHIDEGAADLWADTFTVDGRFESPSYPEPVEGRDDLIAFAQRFTANSPRTRHVITNAHIDDARSNDSSEECGVKAYLLIVRTMASGAVEISRLTTIEDDLVKTNGQWKVRRRRVLLENQ